MCDEVGTCVCVCVFVLCGCGKKGPMMQWWSSLLTTITRSDEREKRRKERQRDGERGGDRRFSASGE